MTSKASQDRLQRILQDLVRQPGNNVCADCKSRAPQWALWNLGIFVCVQCAGIHRKMGVHVSKVKSLTLDNWTREQVETMKDFGNIKSNMIYNPDERRNRPPTNMEDSERDSELEKYIRQKYEFRRFMAGKAPPVPTKDATFLRADQSSPDVTPPRYSDDLLRSGASIARSRTAPVPSTWSEAQARTKARAMPTPSPSARVASDSLALPSTIVPQRSSSAAGGAAPKSVAPTVFDDLIAINTPSQMQPPLQMNPWANIQAQQPPVNSAPALQQSNSHALSGNTIPSSSFASHMQYTGQQAGMLGATTMYLQHPQHTSASLGTMAFSNSPVAFPNFPMAYSAPPSASPGGSMANNPFSGPSQSAGLYPHHNGGGSQMQYQTGINHGTYAQPTMYGQGGQQQPYFDPRGQPTNPFW